MAVAKCGHITDAYSTFGLLVIIAYVCVRAAFLIAALAPNTIRPSLPHCLALLFVELKECMKVCLHGDPC